MTKSSNDGSQFDDLWDICQLLGFAILQRVFHPGFDQGITILGLHHQGDLIIQNVHVFCWSFFRTSG